MTDQWATYADAARDVRVNVGTLSVWVARNKIRTIGRGRGILLHLGDTRRAEREWRLRLEKRRVRAQEEYAQNEAAPQGVGAPSEA